MNEQMTDAQRLAAEVAKLDKARKSLTSVLDSVTKERTSRKDAKDFSNYEVLARIAGHLHTSLSGLEMACAESFNLQSDTVSPRTGGGGKG